MLVITGPPGSGKSHEILEQVRAALSRGASDFRLLVPTATMARRLRIQMAREGFLLRPALISTLSRFIDTWARSFPEASAAALELAVQHALKKAAPREFERVAERPGFRASIAALIDEFSSAGYDSRHLAKALQRALPEAPLAPAFLEVFQEVEREIERRGLVLRSMRLKFAADEIRLRGLPRVHRVLIDGFFSFSDPEIMLIEAIRRHADATIALPDWPGADIAREALAGMGFLERRLAGDSLHSPQPVLVVAQTIEQETEEIARRILNRVAGGGSFRDIGIVLRSQDPYVPALRATLERFGIPAKFYFAEPLADQPAVRLMTGAVEAMRGGWEHAAVLELLKASATGFGHTDACDRFDFAVRERMPGRGLDSLKALSDDPKLSALADRMASLDSWSAQRDLPAAWTLRARALRRLVSAPEFTDRAGHDQVLLWRSHAAALETFEAAMQETAEALPGPQPTTFAEFWDAAAVILRETRFRPPDDRLDAVQVMDVYEARHWQLPAVFVCGLLEKQFPRYHWGEPIFPDAARVSLRGAGIRLRTRSEAQHEEEFLFEIAISRATSELSLSYPESNARGEPNLPSFFLDRFNTTPVRARSARPAADAVERRSGLHAYLRDERLLNLVRRKHSVVRPTAVERFLACPFQFFVSCTLELSDLPPRPGDRLTPRLQGEIVHQALAESSGGVENLESVFARVFESACDRERVPAGCRTELARLTMLRDLKAYAQQAPRLEGWRTYTEGEVEFWLPSDLWVRARIDRFDVAPDGRVVVFDYKYSGPEGIRKRMRGHEEGKSVQGPLYLLGLRQMYGYSPAGMLYCGLRGDVTLDGWHTGVPGIEDGGLCTRQVLIDIIESARTAAIRAAEEIRNGRVEPWPQNRDRCESCAYEDLCRLGRARTGEGDE